MTRGDRGSATVLVLALTAVLALLGGVLTSVGLVVVARHRAAASADLAALAAAARALDGQASACRAARAVAETGGARLVRCALQGEVAVVTAEVLPPGRLARLGPARGAARAGPAVTGTS